MASRRRDRPTASAVAAVVVLLLAVGALFAAGSRRPAPAAPATAHGQPISDVVAACPQGSSGSRILTGSIPAPGLGSSGTLAVRTLTGSTRTVPVQRGPVTSLPAGGGTTVLETTGAAAAGHFGVLVDQTSDGLTALSCLTPRSDWWFTGAGATLDHTSKLLIANVDPGPAVVDVQVLGEQGPVDTVGTRGITVAPRSVRTIALTDIAPQGEDLAVQVQASRGRVVAAVSDSYSRGPTAPTGNDWLPDQPRPSRVVRVAAAPPGGKRTLLVANPSSLTALVGVRVEGRNGIFTPTDGAQIQVPPNSTRAVDVSHATGPGAAGLLLHSRVPVLASVRSSAGGDSVYAGVVRPLENAAAVAWPQPVRARLLLTGGALPSSATVTAFDRSGSPLATTRLRLSPGSTASWKPPAHAEYLTVTPATGDVHGAVLLSSAGGGGAAEVPLDGLPLRVQRPVVQPGQSSL